jgi:predicted dehydrogenase
LASAVLLSGSKKPMQEEIRLMTLDPGHFHAALIQKTMLPGVDSTVHVFAPEGKDLDQHQARIQGFNSRATSPTSWDQKLHLGPSFLEEMIAQRPGNVVVLAGNNKRKTEYIQRCINAGLHVLADKPMAINPDGFQQLLLAFKAAEENKVSLDDIMTERFEIASLLQRELAQIPEVFGTLRPGTPEDPSVTMISVHYLQKQVAGKPLIRPTWFFDVEQQGEALPDVGTHLVDLTLWGSFPNIPLDWQTEITMHSARRWKTAVTRDQFQAITQSDFPEFLQKEIDENGVFQMMANGEATYSVRGIHMKVAALWDVLAPDGGKDTHEATMKGTLATLVIRQGREQNYIPCLFVEPSKNASLPSEDTLKKALSTLTARYPGLSLATNGTGFQILIPEKYHVGHEAHFAQVAQKYFKTLKSGERAAWEIPNLLAKYYITTEAYRLSR